MFVGQSASHCIMNKEGKLADLHPRLERATAWTKQPLRGNDGAQTFVNGCSFERPPLVSRNVKSNDLRMRQNK